MILAHLKIHNLRNIKSISLDLHPQLNIVEGKNGSGKTSLLESLYLLSTGHSFRTREILPLVSHNEHQLTVFTRTFDNQSISIQKSRSSATQVLLNSFPCRASSELASLVPCQVFYQDIFQIIDAGPAIRRNVLDWGMFHVEHSYHTLWKKYRRALKQRNSLLRQQGVLSQLLPWSRILSEVGEELNRLREIYFYRLNEMFKLTLETLTDIKCSLNYYKGWDKRNTGKSLENILNESYALDSSRQFTHYGAHQADLLIEIEAFKAKQWLSRGQQKIVLFALKLAQARLVEKECLFLCDDLPSELDEEHLSRLLDYILSFKGQFFISTINSATLPIKGSNFSRFKLETDHSNQFELR